MSVDPPAQVLIGWKEYVEFPDWNLRRVRAKSTPEPALRHSTRNVMS